MNKNLIKQIACGFAILSAGVGIGIGGDRLYLKKKAQKVEKVPEKPRKIFRKKKTNDESTENTEVKKNPAADSIGTVTEKPAIEDKIQVDVSALEEDGELESETYSRFAKEGSDGTEKDGNGEKIDSKDGESYFINADMYYDDDDGFKSKTITYYTEDGIFTDQNDDPLYDRLIFLGDECADKFNEDDALRTLYVKDPINKTKYEVTCVIGSYAENVLGLGDEYDDDVTYEGVDPID